MLDSTVLSMIPNAESRARALILLSSSYMMLTYQVRQYSTSLEAVMVALALGALRVRTEQGKPVSRFLYKLWRGVEKFYSLA